MQHNIHHKANFIYPETLHPCRSVSLTGMDRMRSRACSSFNLADSSDEARSAACQDKSLESRLKQFHADVSPIIGQRRASTTSAGGGGKMSSSVDMPAGGDTSSSSLSTPAQDAATARLARQKGYLAERMRQQLMKMVPLSPPSPQVERARPVTWTGGEGGLPASGGKTEDGGVGGEGSPVTRASAITSLRAFLASYPDFADGGRDFLETPGEHSNASARRKVKASEPRTGPEKMCLVSDDDTLHSSAVADTPDLRLASPL
jgi:hypothetical protein